MIDYKKLKLAHELVKKIYLRGYFFKQCIVTCFDDIEKIEEVTYSLRHPNQYDVDCKDIDDLIEKLQELTEPKPKYKIGDSAFKLGYDHQDEILLIPIDEIETMEIGSLAYRIDPFRYNGWTSSDLYPSKQALFEAQIEHWTKLKKEETGKESPRYHLGCRGAYDIKTGKFIDCLRMKLGESCSFELPPRFIPSEDECQHESDGMIYTSYPPQNKCKKCREFY